MMESDIACRILTSFDEIETIADAWRDLQKRSGFCVFGCYDWFRSWWHTMGQDKGRELHVVAATRNGRLAGVLPLSIRKILGVRIMKYAGNELFDYCGALAEDALIVRALWETAQNSKLFDLALIRDVTSCAHDFGTLESFAKKTSGEVAPFISLAWPSGEAWFAARDRKQRRNFRCKLQRLEKEGPVSVAFHRSGSVAKETIEKMLLHKIAWCARSGKNGIFSNPLVFPAFQRMAALAAERGHLFLAVLTCRDIEVAHILGFINHGTLHCYFMSYAPEWGHCSPGVVLLEKTIGWAIDNGLKEFDFMRGNEAYKFRYATGKRELSFFRFARTPLGHAGSFLYGIYTNAGAHLKELTAKLPGSCLTTITSVRRKKSAITNRLKLPVLLSPQT